MLFLFYSMIQLSIVNVCISPKLFCGLYLFWTWVVDVVWIVYCLCQSIWLYLGFCIWFLSLIPYYFWFIWVHEVKAPQFPNSDCRFCGKIYIIRNSVNTVSSSVFIQENSDFSRFLEKDLPNSWKICFTFLGKNCLVSAVNGVKLIVYIFKNCYSWGTTDPKYC